MHAARLWLVGCLVLVHSSHLHALDRFPARWGATTSGFKLRSTAERMSMGYLRPARGGADLDPELTARLEQVINSAPVMLFMKGTPESPECGFSKKIVEILKEQKIEFSSFNILLDEVVRQGLKQYSNWPTYPQLYGNGRLVGGLDVIKELVEAGDLKSELGLSANSISTDGATDSAITPETLRRKISEALQAETVDVQDLSDGCGAKFSAYVVAAMFEGMPLIERQRRVHEAIKEEMTRIHALTLKCKTPEQAKTTTADLNK